MNPRLEPILVVLLVLAVAAIIGLAFRLASAKKSAEASQRAAQDERTAVEREAARARAALQSANAEAERQRRDSAMREVALRAEIANLERWRPVADAETRAAEMISAAQELVERFRLEATNLTDEARRTVASEEMAAKEEAARVLSAARGEANESRQKVAQALDRATLQAATIVANANARAEGIAGDAYRAMQNAALFEETARAMKNIIEGYGNQYVIPARSLLDELAFEVGYSEAGQELANARERSRLMIRNSTAATCDYVEDNRRTTAITFVIDAFNGKVDSVLSRVKSDNAGTLAQEVRDAFNVVNSNGRAFRNARITGEYLAARLDELKWAAMAQQIRLDEREEQRRIKEQIREEEKARREYERAIRETAKEEDVLRKAMEKAQEKIRDATAEQRVMYEAQLQELTARLRAAEEKNQRALSMAQQTKRGHVYIISNLGSFGGDVYKIGLTRRLAPLDRIRELGDSSVPFEFDVHALVFSENAPALESQLHKHFVLMQMNKVNHRKEFFRVDLAHMRQELESLGLSATWTMTARAREYYETLAIEKVIAEDPSKRQAWIERQLALEAHELLAPEVEDAAIA